MRAVGRKPVAPSSRTPSADYPADTIPLSQGVKNLIVVTVPGGDTMKLDQARRSLQRVVGGENVVLIIPEGCRLEVISLTADTGGERAAVKVHRRNAKWNI